MNNETEPRIQESEVKIQIERLTLQPEDIILVTVSRKQPMTIQFRERIFHAIRKFCQNKIFIKQDDIAIDKLADFLTPEDLDRIAKRMERKKLSQPIPPEQHENKRPFSGQ